MGNKKYQDLEKVQSVTIRGKRYAFGLRPGLIRRKQAQGLTDPPDKKGKSVTIDPSLPPKEMLATLIDEFIHCSMWEISNDVVDEMSDDLAHALWRCGLRFRGVDED
jgi:hypothetical protein